MSFFNRKEKEEIKTYQIDVDKIRTMADLRAVLKAFPPFAARESVIKLHGIEKYMKDYKKGENNEQE